jgi:hypothetical protein
MRSFFLKGITVAFALGAVPSLVSAQRLLEPHEYTLSWSPLESNLGIEAVGTIYNSLGTASTGGTSSNNPNAPVVEDFVSISPDPVNALSLHSFVGGVATANHVLFFNFYDTNSVFTGGYGVRLPQAGNFIWNITIADPQTVRVPNAGFAAMFPDSGVNNPGGVPSNVTFRFTNTPPAVGSTAGTIYRQSITTINAVPEPGSVALMIGLGISGLVLRRKIRK